MKAYLFDIIIVLILAFFAWRGAKKGLILTLCSLLGIFIAFFGARWVSAEFYAPVADIIEPPIYQSIVNMGKEEAGQQEAASNLLGTEGLSGTYSLEDLLEMVKESDLYSGFSEFLDEAADGSLLQGIGSGSAARAVSAYLAQVIAKAALFAITFLVILLVWFLLGHILDLAFQLPGLSAVNWVGGLVFGLVKAVLLVMVLVWLFQLLGWVARPPETPVVSMFTVQRVLSLLDGLVA